LEVIPQNTQLCHWYGSGWWSARGVKRLDIGTVKHPAPLRGQRVLAADNNHPRQTKKNEKIIPAPANKNNNKKKKNNSVVSSTTGTGTYSHKRKKRKVSSACAK